MNNRKRLILYSVGIILMIFQIAIYLYFRSILVNSYLELNGFDKFLSIILILLFITIGIIHILLFFDLLKHIPNIKEKLFKFSASLVLIPISGIVLLSDATILSDIGKEYILFDVTNEWSILFAFSVFHILTFLYSGYITRNIGVAKTGLREAINSSNENMYKSFNQIIVISSTVGVVFAILFLFNIFNFLTYENYVVVLALIMMTLLMIPIAIFICFYIIKFHKKPINKWLDENEWFISIKGMAIALISGWGFILIGILLSLQLANFSLIIWLIMTIFLQLGITSIYALLKYR